MTPFDAAKRKAEELLLSMKSALTNKFTREEAFFIRDQIAAALHIKPGHIRDSEGVDLKVLPHYGDRGIPLSITKDGVVVLAGAIIYSPISNGYGVVPGVSRNGPVDFTDGGCFVVGDCFSTREAAQQSASERGGGG